MAYPILAIVNIGGLSSIKELFVSAITSNEGSSGSMQYMLHIQCKYYQADIIIREIDKEQDLNGSEAALIYFDAFKESSWKGAQRWMNAVDKLELPLRLLVCTRVPLESQSNSRPSQLIEPCFRRLAIEQEFELIELDPHKDSLEEGDEFGIQRIKSALEAHMWSNMELLDPSSKPSLFAPVNAILNRGISSNTDSPTVLPNHSLCSEGSQPPLPVELDPSNVDKDTSRKSVTEEPLDLVDEQSMDSFERAFQAIVTTRDRMSQLDHAERRKLAEKLTFQLWRAVGGSSDEIDGLSDDGTDDQ